MKSIVTQTLGRNFVERRRGNRPAERGRITESGIIDQDEQDIWRTGWRLHWFSERRYRAFERSLCYAFKRLRRTRQHGPIPLRICSGR